MGKEKAGFLSPKAISNRIKAKGLQKLRWYCQMCQKQCRDENGFKCHTMSESHQRQLLLVAESPDSFIDTFSQDFLKAFLELLRRRYGTKRVHANVVYQEYISDREHLHMNSTQWETLTDFVKWLGKEGHCTVDHTEKGWFITWIDRDPETIRRQELLAAKVKMDVDDEEKIAAFIERQVKRESERRRTEGKTPEFTELQRENEEEKIAFKLPVTTKPTEQTTKSDVATSEKNPLKMKPKTSLNSSSTSKDDNTPAGKRKSALDEIMEEEERKKAKTNRKDYWLTEDIVVKVTTRKLGEKYYKQKAVVKQVVDNYAAIVKMLNSGDKLKVDQVHLETVIPAQGKLVQVLNGAYRSHKATLVGLDEKNFSCSVKIASGPLHGRIVEGVPYEDVCKIHVT